MQQSIKPIFPSFSPNSTRRYAIMLKVQCRFLYLLAYKANAENRSSQIEETFDIILQSSKSQSEQTLQAKAAVSKM